MWIVEIDKDFSKIINLISARTCCQSNQKENFYNFIYTKIMHQLFFFEYFQILNFIIFSKQLQLYSKAYFYPSQETKKKEREEEENEDSKI